MNDAQTQPQPLPNLTTVVAEQPVNPPMLAVAPTQSTLEEKRLKLADRLRKQSDDIMDRYRKSDNKDKSMWLSVKNAFTWAYAHVFTGAAWLVDAIENLMNYVAGVFKAAAVPIINLAKKVGDWFTSTQAKVEQAPAAA
jgi:argonaute-like protein implicated in RNA metabolism and viral defense